MSDTDDSWLTLEQVTLLSDESVHFGSDRSGFSSFGHSTVSSLLTEYEELFHTLTLLRKPPSEQSVEFGNTDDLPKRLTDFDPAFMGHEKFGSFRPLYQIVRDVQMLTMEHPCLGPNPIFFTVSYKKGRFQLNKHS